MKPRFVGKLSVADVVTVANAGLGFLAVVAAFESVELGARLILLAAIADGLDGLLARKLGSTRVGEYLDSLADVASFSVAPAVLVYVGALAGWGIGFAPTDPQWLATSLVAALFVGAGVVRLGLYTAYEAGTHRTVGVPTTLAATVLAAAVLAGLATPVVLVGGAAVFTYLMVTNATYPDLAARDALAMGAVQAGAVLVPTVAGRLFPRALLAVAVAYLVLGPWFYWGADDEGADSAPGTTGEGADSAPGTDPEGADDEAEGKRS